MKAIETRYIGPSNVRGSRIKATAEGGHSLTLHWDDSYSSEWNHSQAARALRTKLEWRGTMVGGGLPKGGMAWVFVDEYSPKFD